ncbi:lipocalin family protein [Chitinophaga rhizophila]|uniref:Lipocalin-like domain-containing protein n=1 Tax=Chitinophaga rhizophila TaxID=2866212 RepID=A0ABS7GJL3_9BACT|nr:lipocalin family protein [Chitinophaga rhizophila]MBW8687576.1 hypothetical protein [Chitinophaga rhizophila]
MKCIPLIAIAVTLLMSCENKPAAPAEAATDGSRITGTWKLISAKSIEKGDTTVTAPVSGQETIKIFNNSHFAFFTHDLQHGTDSATAVFGSGSGTYTLAGDTYSEHLIYCSYRGWEDKDFTFKMKVSQDTIVQSGEEKIDSLNVDHQIIETYVRVKS